MLEQFKKDAKTLYARGHLTQAQCCDVLGLREPFGPIMKLVVRVAAFFCRKAVVHTEPNE
jgi:hypothetical protein